MEELTNDNYKDKTGEGLVIVDFYAPWCGPCKSFAPIFEQTAEKFSEVHFYKVNVDDAADAAQEHGVMSIPTVVFFKDGEVVKTHVGMFMGSQFEAAIKDTFGL